MISSALGEVEERTLALEARAFSAPGRRTVLRTLPDSGLQRLARWGAMAVVVAIVGASLAGAISLP
jgi:energy-coupling factor transport system permease protein